MAALVDVVNQARFLTELKNQNLDLNELIFGVHTYQSVNDVENRMSKVRATLDSFCANGAKIWVTELGVNYKDKHVLMPMILAAWRHGAEMVLVHELPDWGKEGGFFGVIDPGKQYATHFIFDLSTWTREVGEVKRWLRRYLGVLGARK